MEAKDLHLDFGQRGDLRGLHHGLGSSFVEACPLGPFHTRLLALPFVE